MVFHQRNHARLRNQPGQPAFFIHHHKPAAFFFTHELNGIENGGMHAHGQHRPAHHPGQCPRRQIAPLPKEFCHIFFTQDTGRPAILFDHDTTDGASRHFFNSCPHPIAFLHGCKIPAHDAGDILQFGKIFRFEVINDIDPGNDSHHFTVRIGNHQMPQMM